MKIDVLMPFHRQDQYFQQAIGSILRSNRVSVRLILIDDRPLGGKPIPLPFSNYEYVITGGIGYAKALRIGFKHVQSEFVGFLDSDDLTHPDRLWQSIEALIENDAAICFSPLWMINLKGKSRLVQPPYFKNPVNLRPLQLIGSVNSNSSWVFKRVLLEDPNFFPSSYESIDWATTLLMTENHKVVCLEEPLYFYRQHISQMTRSADYRANSFKEIYPLWAALNKELNLKFLGIYDALAISAPWAAESVWNRNCDVWVEQFLKSGIICGKSDQYSARIVLLKRKLASTKRLNSRYKLIIFNLHNIAGYFFNYPFFYFFRIRSILNSQRN